MGIIKYSWMLMGKALLVAAIAAGCSSSAPPSSRAAAGTQPSAQGDYLTDQAGGMAAEDARRTQTATPPAPQKRPEPVRRSSGSPVDQPRLR